MRLLSRTEAKSKRSEAEAWEASKLASLRSQITELTFELNSLRERSNQEKAELQEKYVSLFRELEGKAQVLREEVSRLEANRKEGMAPVKERIRQVSAREKEISARFLDIEKRDKELTEWQSELAEMKAKLSDEESDIEERKQRLALKESAATEQSIFISQAHVKLNQDIQAFQAHCVEKEQELEQKREAVRREQALLEPDRKFIAQEKENIWKENARIASERDALLVAKNEFKKKGIL